MNNVKRTALLGISCMSALLTVSQAQAEPTLYLGMNGGTDLKARTGKAERVQQTGLSATVADHRLAIGQVTFLSLIHI